MNNVDLTVIHMLWIERRIGCKWAYRATYCVHVLKLRRSVSTRGLNARGRNCGFIDIMNRYGKVRGNISVHDKVPRSRRARLRYVAVLPVLFILGWFLGSSVQRSINDGKSLRESISSYSGASFDEAGMDWRSCTGHAGCCIVHGPSEWKQHRISDVRMGWKYWHLATYRSDDIVSSFPNTGVLWDEKKSRAIIRDMAILSGVSKPPAIFIDVGANIGWFSFIAANYGYTVFAFEPFKENLARFNHSLCLGHPKARKRITVFPFALGSRDGTCEQWSTPSNHGNAITVCESSETSRVKKWLDISGHDFLGNIQMRKLDDVEIEMRKADVWKREQRKLDAVGTLVDPYHGGKMVIPEGATVVMKIDTEGFEAAVIMGAKKFFESAITKPKVIYSEFCRLHIQKAGLSMGMNREEALKLPDAYLEDMKSMGYVFDPPSDKLDAIQDIVFRLRPT